MACGRWQNRPHDGLRDPLNPQRNLTPNEKYASLLAISGYVPGPLTGDDYVALLPSCRTVTVATASPSTTASTTRTT